MTSITTNTTTNGDDNDDDDDHHHRKHAGKPIECKYLAMKNFEKFIFEARSLQLLQAHGTNCILYRSLSLSHSNSLSTFLFFFTSNFGCVENWNLSTIFIENIWVENSVQRHHYPFQYIAISLEQFQLFKHQNRIENELNLSINHCKRLRIEWLPKNVYHFSTCSKMVTKNYAQKLMIDSLRYYQWLRSVCSVLNTVKTSNIHIAEH